MTPSESFGVSSFMAAITNVRWDNLTSIHGCAPIYDVDRNRHCFYLMHDGSGSYVAELLEGLGFEERQSPGSFQIPWAGPYTYEEASDIVRWFLSLVGAQVGDTSKYEAIIAYTATRDRVSLAICVSPLLGESHPQALPQWFNGSLV